MFGSGAFPNRQGEVVSDASQYLGTGSSFAAGCQVLASGRNAVGVPIAPIRGDPGGIREQFFPKRIGGWSKQVTR